MMMLSLVLKNSSTGKHDDVVTSTEENNPCENVIDVIGTVKVCNNNANTERVIGSACGSVVTEERLMPKQSDRIKYKITQDAEWKRARVLSRGGKQTGKNIGWINIQEDDNEAASGIDLKPVDQWEFAETSAEEVVLVLVPKIEHRQQIIQEKEKERNLWK